MNNHKLFCNFHKIILIQKRNHITVGGFKNIENFTIKLADITSLLSVNSYGKSNTLSAILFGINFISSHSKAEMMEIFK